MEKYGFVYIWFDRKHKRYYIGCRWGNENDGYICSSSWMKQAYKHRSDDFKRKIIKRIYTNRKHLLEEEYKWLSMIKDSELGTKYYNLKNHSFGHWSSYDDKKISIGKKISKSQRSNPNFGKWNKGKVLSEELKKRISDTTSIAMKEHYKHNPRTEETRKKISDNSKRLQAEKKVGMHGRKHSKETIEKMKINNSMNKLEHREKVKAVKQGIKWLKKDNSKKMAVPNTPKWIELIDLGYKPIGVSF